MKDKDGFTVKPEPSGSPEGDYLLEEMPEPAFPEGYCQVKSN